jgi:hypothetical protein
VDSATQTSSGKRAATALRVIAIGELILVARLVVIGILRDAIISDLRSGKVDSTAAFKRLDLFSQISLYSHVATAIVVGVGLLLLVLTLARGRGLAIGALIALVAHLGLMTANRMIKVPNEIPLSIHLMWWADGFGLTVASMLPLVAVARARPSSFSRLAALGALSVILIDSALSGYGLTVKAYTPVLAWVERSVAIAGAAWFASFAFPLAKRLTREADEPAEARPAGTLDGTPLRALAWVLLARIGFGVVLQILIMLSMFNGEYENAGVLTSFGTAIGVVLSLVIIGALVGYLRYPVSHRSDSLGVAIVVLVVGVALDIVATNAANELFGLVGEAKRATSFWGMPSLSKIEDLQTTIAWAGRASLLLGLGAGFALATSLLRTASAIADAELASQARRVMTLLIVAGVGALFVSFLAASPKRDMVGFLLVAAVALLGVALFLVVDWMRLLFGLASAVERPPVEFSEPRSEEAAPAD